MKSFIKYLIIVICTILVGLYVMDKLYTYVYNKNISINPRNKTQYVLGLKDKKIDYIFLGSSRVENHINTKLVEELTGKSALNVGTQGANLEDIFLFLKLLHSQNIHFEKIFIQIDYNFNDASTSQIVKSQALPFVNNSVIDQHLKKRNSDYWKLKNIPFYRYLITDYSIGIREFFFSLIMKKPRINLENGFDPRYKTYRGQEATLPNTIVQRNEVFTAIDEFCKTNAIDVVYFCAPFCTKTKNKDYIDSLKLKIPLLRDYSRMLQNDDLYFDDCGHLNAKGANEFTKILINDL